MPKNGNISSNALSIIIIIKCVSSVLLKDFSIDIKQEFCVLLFLPFVSGREQFKSEVADGGASLILLKSSFKIRKNIFFFIRC